MTTKISLDNFKVEWVESTRRLVELSLDWRSKKQLAVDTEFERRTTYFARLALVQIFDGDKLFLIDPLKVECPIELKTIFESHSIVKIFHSSKEDLEVLYTSWNCQINQLFDTQVANSFLKQNLSIGYSNLVEEMFQIPVDKKETTSDWLKRPLSDKQKIYAAKDVLYLIEIFKIQKAAMDSSKLNKYFNAECNELCKNAVKNIIEKADYRNAKDVWRLNSKQMGLFEHLFNWREDVARKEDRTKNHIIKDHELVELALLNVDSREQIRSIKSLHPRSFRLYANQWLKLTKEWSANGSAENPVILNPRDVVGLKAKSQEIETAVNNLAKEKSLNPTLLLSKRVIRKLAQAFITKQSPPQQWSGWRKALLKSYIEERV